MHERFLVHLQLCFVVSFVLRVPGLEEGVISRGKAWGWTTGTLIWMPGAVGARRANIPSLYLLLLLYWCCTEVVGGFSGFSIRAVLPNINMVCRQCNKIALI